MATAAVGTGATLSTAHEAATSLLQRGWQVLSQEERQALLLENLSEVRRIARQIHLHLPRCVPFDDLAHEGVMGLIDAVEKYDPAKKVRFQTYASFRIRGAILDSLRGLDWGPRQLRRQVRRIEQARRALSLQLGRTPSEVDVAAELGVSLGMLQEILRQAHCSKIETGQPISELDSKRSTFAMWPDRSQENPFDVCARAEINRTLEQAMDMLREKEQKALTLYYFEELTMKEIGRVLKVQESRISQIIAAALCRLRALMQTHQDNRGQPSSCASHSGTGCHSRLSC
ncbi:MAG TPA: FliA/WhiG family RNA polymerase sigma factor [Candidatus Acidoferrum sp.]|nr:FliA/WhiG family RNA polymerase sigma factor [Candidatus Acidoferrum sp.]